MEKRSGEGQERMMWETWGGVKERKYQVDACGLSHQAILKTLYIKERIKLGKKKSILTI